MDRVLELFADILDYPAGDVARSARECRKAAEAAGLPTPGLEEFSHSVEALPPEKLEEIYTATFDLNASASPYVGYHLFGEGYQRSLFLLELQKRYRTRGHEPGQELADHLCVLLRFLSDCEDRGEKEELIREALIPALDVMIEKSTPSEKTGAGPYAMALAALRGALEGE